MRGVLRFFVVPLVVAMPIVAVAAACNNDDTGLSCHVDTDCPTGNICRNAVCGLTNPDAGTNVDSNIVDTDSGDTACSGDGILCTLAEECCSGTCDESRCAQQPSSTPVCKNVYELCQDDCCAGLSCTNGSCR